METVRVGITHRKYLIEYLGAAQFQTLEYVREKVARLARHPRGRGA